MDGIDWLSEAKVVEQERSTWLTVERAAYAVIGLLAAAVRLWQLGLRPLAETEAAQALAAFRFTQGMGQAVPAGTVPALFTGNAVAFTLFGSSDGLARWLPALAGLALVLLPYWLRHRLGRGGALAASLLLALSPLAAWVALRAEIAWPPVVLGLAVVFWVSGFDVIYASQDVAFDQRMRLHSIPARLGVAPALRVAALCHLAMLAALAALPAVYPGFGAIYWSGIGAIALLLVYEHWLVRPDDLARVNRAFFHVNAVVSVGLFAVGAIDVMV